MRSFGTKQRERLLYLSAYSLVKSEVALESDLVEVAWRICENERVEGESQTSFDKLSTTQVRFEGRFTLSLRERCHVFRAERWRRWGEEKTR